VRTVISLTASLDLTLEIALPAYNRRFGYIMIHR
jgi:hypothetical protein